MSDLGTLKDLGDLDVPGIPGPRRVRVYLPPCKPPHPVLYMFDGQNLFGDEGSYSGGWHVHEVMASLARRKRHTAAIVAIHHGGEHRIGDYAPIDSKQYGKGRADATLDFVTAVLKPRIDAEFPVRPDRSSTFVGGSSMGALISLYAILRHPDTFGGAIGMSPALWFGGGALLQMAKEKPVYSDSRIYIDVGEREMGPWGVFLVRGLEDVLAQRGLSPGRLAVRIDARGHHRESDWRRRLPIALHFLLRQAAGRRTRRAPE